MELTFNQLRSPTEMLTLLLHEDIAPSGRACKVHAMHGITFDFSLKLSSWRWTGMAAESFWMPAEGVSAVPRPLSLGPAIFPATPCHRSWRLKRRVPPDRCCHAGANFMGTAYNATGIMPKLQPASGPGGSGAASSGSPGANTGGALSPSCNDPREMPLISLSDGNADWVLVAVVD